MTSEEKVRRMYPKSYRDHPLPDEGGGSRIREGVYPNIPIGQGADDDSAWADAWRNIQAQQSAGGHNR